MQGESMTNHSAITSGNVELFPNTSAATPVTDELTRILALLKDVCPAGAMISFDFDGRLHVHIDVRKREDVTILESILPPLGRGLFHGFRRSATPHHPFFHRVSALVAS
jgi:hypothetical protein